MDTDGHGLSVSICVHPLLFFSLFYQQKLVGMTEAVKIGPQCATVSACLTDFNPLARFHIFREVERAIHHVNTVASGAGETIRNEAARFFFRYAAA